MGTASFNYVPTRLLARTEQAAVADGKNQSLLSISLSGIKIFLLARALRGAKYRPSRHLLHSPWGRRKY